MNAKERREKLKSEGLCVDCGASPATEGLACSVCREKRRASNRGWKGRHRECVNEKHREYRRKNKKAISARQKESAFRLRKKVIDFCGGKCECCGEATIEFLQLDHVEKNGKIHREKVGQGRPMLRHILSGKCEYKIRVLCANCHNAITCYGVCPHEKN